VGHDLQIFPWTISPAEPGEGPIFEIYVALMKPLSRGSLRLSASDPAAPPVIDLGFFTDPGDMPRVIHAVRVARRLAMTPPLSDVALQELFPGSQIPDVTTDLEAAIRTKAGTYFHPVGTCRMGPVGDVGAVVDAKGSVHGVEGLYVVDASIMSTIPASRKHQPANTHAGRAMLGMVS